MEKKSLKPYFTAAKKSGVNPEKNGLSLQIEKPQDEVRRLAELGYIEEEDLEKRLGNIPDYIKYNIKLVTDNK